MQSKTPTKRRPQDSAIRKTIGKIMTLVPIDDRRVHGTTTLNVIDQEA
ncbi:MAG: hypothetical protein ACFCD0_18265 [Gemmataceae bacterium]